MRLAYSSSPLAGGPNKNCVYGPSLFGGPLQVIIFMKGYWERCGRTFKLSLFVFFKFQRSLIPFCTKCLISGFHSVSFYLFVCVFFLFFSYGNLNLISQRADFCTILGPLAEVETM